MAMKALMAFMILAVPACLVADTVNYGAPFNMDVVVCYNDCPQLYTSEPDPTGNLIATGTSRQGVTLSPDPNDPGAYSGTFEVATVTKTRAPGFVSEVLGVELLFSDLNPLNLGYTGAGMAVQGTLTNTPLSFSLPPSAWGIPENIKSASADGNTITTVFHEYNVSQSNTLDLFATITIHGAGDPSLVTSPEPTTCALIALPLLVLGVVRRKMCAQ